MKNSVKALVHIATTNKDENNAIMNFSIIYQQDLYENIISIAPKYYNYHYGRFSEQIGVLKRKIRGLKISKKSHDELQSVVLNITKLYGFDDLWGVIEEKLLEDISKE